MSAARLDGSLDSLASFALIVSNPERISVSLSPSLEPQRDGLLHHAFPVRSFSSPSENPTVTDCFVRRCPVLSIGNEHIGKRPRIAARPSCFQMAGSRIRSGMTATPSPSHRCAAGLQYSPAHCAGCALQSLSLRGRGFRVPAAPPFSPSSGWSDETCGSGRSGRVLGGRRSDRR
jgi:hypothetical protein